MDDVGLDALVGELPKCVLIEDLGYLYPNENSKQKARFGIYECGFCGTHFKVETANIKNSATQSCGCYKRSLMIKRNRVHDGRSTRLYGIWAGIKDRTSRKNNKHYSDYGGRGITMCEEWVDDFTKFRDWSLDKGYIEEDKGLSIDRIDVNGNYEPNNCRWTTTTIQARNRRMMSNNKSGFKGVRFKKENNKYQARVTVDKVQVNLGLYLTVIEGALAYNNYIIENNLEGFILNVIPEEFKDIIPKRITRK